MMKKMFLLLAVVSTILLLSCGGGKKNKKEKISMTPITTEVSGALSDCFEVVDEECIVKLNGNELFPTWRIKLRRTDAPLPFEEGLDVESYGTTRTDGKNYYHVGFGIEIVDEDEYTVRESKATTGGMGGPYSSDDVTELLKLKPGEEGSIRWSVESESDATSALKFRITSAYDLVKGGGSSSSSSSDIDDDDDWDEYDKAVETSKKMLKAAEKASSRSTRKALEAYEDALDALDDWD